MNAIEIQAAWISGWFTLSAAGLAFGLLACQMWWQGRQNRAADRMARRQAFNEALYVDGVAAARALSNVANSFFVQLISAQEQINLAIKLHKAIGAVRPPATRYADLLAIEKSFGGAVNDLVFLLEERRISDERLEVLKQAFLAKAYDVQKAFRPEFQWHLLTALPQELPNGTPINYAPLDEPSFEDLKKGFAAVIVPLSDCVAFCEDLIVELQNVHLGDVFETKLPHRVPPDPSRVVLRLDDHESLAAWIETTPWERNNKEAEARFEASLLERSRGEI